MPWAVETEKLGKVFRTNWGRKKRALAGLDLQIAYNEIFGYLGHNGAGKTTTIKILVGLIRATEGVAKINGIPACKKARKVIGFLPENISFHEYLTGMETIEFYARLHGLSQKESRRRAEVLLEEIGLKEAAHRAVREYSKGMKQRLGLIQAMVHDPQILILDEPLTGLDPVGRRELREKIRALKERGKTVFFTSHILADVELLCDRVALISQGKLIAVGELDTLLDPKTISVDVIGEGFSEAALAEIKTFGARIITEGKKTAVRVKDEAEAQKVKSLLEQSGGSLKAYIPQKEGLEDFYLRQTKGERSCE